MVIPKLKYLSLNLFNIGTQSARHVTYRQNKDSQNILTNRVGSEYLKKSTLFVQEHGQRALCSWFAPCEVTPKRSGHRKSCGVSFIRFDVE